MPKKSHSGGRDEDRPFKKLTPQNWTDRDRTIDPIVRIDRGETISNDEWAARILEKELSDSVPREVRNLFEVAQGAICYGCFFYPLFTLGNEQLYRVLEAAVTAKCEAEGAPSSCKTYKRKTEWLYEQGHISDDRIKRFEAARLLRNMTSHAAKQMILPPNYAVSGVELTAALIEGLFSGDNRPL